MCEIESFNIQLSFFRKYITNLEIIVACMSVIYLKRQDDILQGVSKLDYLIKLSIFQKPRVKKKKTGVFQ